MAGLLELLISTVALLVLSDASFEWVLQTIWNILMNNHVHGTLKICCSFLEVSPEVIFVESDPWTCIAYKLGFSYVNDILWKIFFDSFLRSDSIQKKKTFGGEQYCLVFMSSSMVPWKDCWSKSRLSRKQKTELCERKVQQGSRDKDRFTSASECILNKAFLFVDYVKNKEFIINPDDLMFFLFTTSPSIVDNKLRFLSPKARQAHYVLCT